MSRGFYRVVLCAFAARENWGTLIVMVKHGEGARQHPALPCLSIRSAAG